MRDGRSRWEIDFLISRIHTDVLEFLILIFAFLITQPGVHFNLTKIAKANYVIHFLLFGVLNIIMY